jgi:hypothetical protein
MLVHLGQAKEARWCMAAERDGDGKRGQNIKLLFAA